MLPRHRNAQEYVLEEMSKIRGIESLVGELHKSMLEELAFRAAISLRNEYKDQLDGTPELLYLDFIASSYIANPNSQFVLDKKIDEIGLKQSTVEKLQGNFNTVYIGDLIQLPKKELLRTPTIGKKTVDDIDTCLAPYGLTAGIGTDISILRKLYASS